MRVILTAHARFRAFLRGISREMIEEVIEHSDQKGVGYRNRSLAFKSFGERGTLKVVYAEERDRVVVITIIWEE